MREFDSVTVVGCGGIGTWLMPPLARLLAKQGFKGEMHLWDGDRFEDRNRARQEFDLRGLGLNKAEVVANQVRANHPLTVVDHREYVTADNVAQAVPEGGLVVTCLDNHPARALIDRAAGGRKFIVVLSAGNEKLDGNVHVRFRRNGEDLTQPLLVRHPEIATDKRGDREAGCEDLIEAGETQYLTTNYLAAAGVLVALGLLQGYGERAGSRKQTTMPQEVFFHVWEGLSVVPVMTPGAGA
jgi:molybdopterin/thiamine biosynthesis adenylyltransferase